MKVVRGSVKPRFGCAGKRSRRIELVRTVERGPYECPGEAPWFFVVKIYKDLEKKKTFFPIVFRRGLFRITPGFANGPGDRQLDVIEPRFAPEDFTRANEAAALKCVSRKVRDTFDAGASGSAERRPFASFLLYHRKGRLRVAARGHNPLTSRTHDMAGTGNAKTLALLSGVFTATGPSAAVELPRGMANLSLRGGVGTVKVERSFDGGTNYDDVSLDALGTLASYALNSTEVSLVIDEPEQGVLWRLNCTAYTSGNIVYRISQ